MKAIFIRSVLQLVRRPIYWVAFFILPLFCFMLLTSLMQEGLPSKVPAAMIDKDGSSLSRNVTQNLGGMQMVDLKESCNSYTEARHLMQKGDIFGFFLIPENFERDLLSGRKPVITFYTNMTYFVPASILFKTFKTTALYTKAGVAMTVLESVGASPQEV
ncbi:MAG: ABC transporter permease, partial [Duncaniella sp.]|nr:ABC transporter permease [Duncaniella sp.]